MTCTGKECRVSEGRKLDMRGIPTRSCVCGSDTFKVLVKFDDDNTIAWYTTSGYCAACGAAVTVPTEVDDVVA